MSFANRHNKGGVDWKIDDLKTEGFQLWKREECYKEAPEKTYKLRGIYINKKGKVTYFQITDGEQQYSYKGSNFSLDNIKFTDYKGLKVTCKQTLKSLFFLI